MITFNLAHLPVERPLLAVRREKFLKEINLKINPRLIIHFLSKFLNPCPNTMYFELTGDNLKVVWVKLSTLSQTVLPRSNIIA